MWSNQQISQHQKAANKLDQIMRAAFRFIKQNSQDLNEDQVRVLIKQRLKSNGLISDCENPIVAFGKNCANVHHFSSPEKKTKLEKNNLVMIDLWAKLNEKGAPFADITWMGYHGTNFSGEIANRFNIILEARDAAIKLIQNSVKKGKIPTGKEIDDVVRECFDRYSLSEYFCHSTGHPLGTSGAHGRSGGGIWRRNKNSLKTNLAYTIEPGLYFKGMYGLRSELDFYVSDQYELFITSQPQTAIIMI